jgi:hypothetical protein
VTVKPRFVKFDKELSLRTWASVEGPVKAISLIRRKAWNARVNIAEYKTVS